MEIVRVQGSKSKILIKPGQTLELGRAHGFSSSDRTISRRHISFFNPSQNHSEEIRLQFEVVGKNPIFVNKDDGVKIFRRFERGEMESGDMFCVSVKNPIWYALRRVENGGENVIESVLESELARSLESGSEIVGIEDLQQEGLDFSDVDHVKEFGFVVMGHEFDSYPKKMLRDIKNWDWFLEEPSKGSEDDEDEGRKVRGSGRRKRKKGEENDDEDWTGESEDDKELMNKSRKSQNPKYMTRSKNSSKPSKDNKKSKSTTGKQNRIMDEEDMEDEDEDDETLGGFIGGDQNLEDEQIGDEEEDEEEEELEDEYDEDEDEDE